jgi:hypothetical protein
MGCVMFASLSRHYGPDISRGSLSVLFKFGLPHAGANFVNFILLNVDYAFVGDLLGAIALGIYVLAFNLASTPGLPLGNVFNSVAMPAFSRVKHDRDLLKDAMANGFFRSMARFLLSAFCSQTCHQISSHQPGKGDLVPGPGCVGGSAGSALGGFAVRQPLLQLLIGPTTGCTGLAASRGSRRLHGTGRYVPRHAAATTRSGPVAVTLTPISAQRLGVGGRWDVSVAMSPTESRAPREELTWRR